MQKKKNNNSRPGNDGTLNAHVHRQNDAKKFYIDDRETYYFDRILINCILDINGLGKILPIDRLKKECSEFKLRGSHLHWTGYATAIDVVAPTKKYLRILSKALIPDAGYKITYIEIAHDIFFPSQHEAQRASYEIFSTIWKKYSIGFVYDEEKAGKKKDGKDWRDDYLKRGLFSDRTFYSDYVNRNDKGKRIGFKHVIYARLSKLNRKPCVHYEWRILKAKQIREKTSIRKIQDLLNFDFERFFRTMEKKYIIHRVLNRKKIGKVLAGLERKRKLNESESLHVDLAYATFRSHHDIRSVSDFVYAVNKEYLSHRKKKGRKSPWAKQIKKLSKVSQYCSSL